MYYDESLVTVPEGVLPWMKFRKKVEYLCEFIEGGEAFTLFVKNGKLCHYPHDVDLDSISDNSPDNHSLKGLAREKGWTLICKDGVEITRYHATDMKVVCDEQVVAYRGETDGCAINFIERTASKQL